MARAAVDLADTSLTMGALIGLGVGIDYALFIVTRCRKALVAGADAAEAVAQAPNTSGRAVIFAGLTVIVALLGMFVVNLGVLTGKVGARDRAQLVVFAYESGLVVAGSDTGRRSDRPDGSLSG